jgi:outer membrane protein assembly factor BamB
MKTKPLKSGILLIYGKMVFVVAITIIFTITGCTRQDKLQGWQTYRHDETRSGVTTEQLPSRLFLKWTYIPVHAPEPIWTLPAEEMPRIHSDNTYHVSAVNGMAYFGSSVNNKVYALDISTGKEKWVFFTEGPVRFSPSIWKNRIYFGSDDGYVYCLRAKSGKLIWKYRPGPKDKKVLGNGNMVSLWPVRTSVLVEDGIVYFGAGVFPYDGLYVCALNAINGSVIWKNDDLDDDTFDLNYGGVSPQSYLIASENNLFVPSGRAMPAVFNRTNGKFLYYLSPSGKQGGTWGMIDQEELIAGIDRSGTPTKVSYDAETGERKGDVFASFTGIDMVVSGNISFVVTEDGVYAIDRVKYPVIQQKIDSIQREQNSLTGSFREMALGKVANRLEFDKQLNEISHKLNLLIAEEEKLKSSLSKWFFLQEHLSSIILAGNQIITGGTDIVLGLDSETGKEVWRNNVKGIAYGLAVSDQSLIVSTDEGPIYCFTGEVEKEDSENQEEITPGITDSPYQKDNIIYEKAASSILKKNAIDNGYCLVLDCGEGQLVYELARRSNLNIVGIEKNQQKVKEAKNKLDKAGLYGSKVIVENWSINSLPEYFANLVVSGNILKSGRPDVTPGEIFRVLKPAGGKVCFGIPETEGISEQTLNLEKMADEWKNFEIHEPEIIREDGNWIIFTRKSLRGAGGWTHQYGDAANTCCSDDKLVMAPFSTLWYGPPGPQLIPDRHAKAVAPVAFDGKLIVEGEDIIIAIDAYNGTILWERKIEGANRVRADMDGGNMAINRYGLFVAVKDKCLQLDIETGETIQVFNLPSEWNGKPRRWGYIAIKDKILFGSAAMPLNQEYNQLFNTLIDDGSWEKTEKLEPLEAVASVYYKYEISENTEKVEQAFQRDGTKWQLITDFPAWDGGIEGLKGTSDRIMTSDGIFAIDIETGKTIWTHKGKKIAQITVSIGDETVFFAENAVTTDQRQKALVEKEKYIQKGNWEEFDTKLGPDEADIRLVYALDVLSGQKKWEKAIDLSGCGDDQTASAYKNSVLLFFGSFGLHDKWRFPAGELRWHRVTALSAENGEFIWSRPLNYMVRPLLIKDEVIIEPRKCNLYTGEIKTRIHPVTGEHVPWEFYRPGHTCAATAGNENCLFYRSYNTAYYDLKEDKGLSYYGAIRPGCWINMIPGNGLVLFPEASSGCTCSFPLRTSVVLKPEKNEEVEDWSLYISHGPLTPVEHLAINLGAPGDKKDDNGTIWFGYPRPDITTDIMSYTNEGIAGVNFDINEEIYEGMGYYSYDSKGLSIEGTNYPWLFTNGCVGLSKCEIPLINNYFGEKAGIFTIRLGFAAPSTKREFDIKIQDKVVEKGLDILKEAGEINKAVIKEFKGVEVKDILKIELVPDIPNPEINNSPVINFIEVIREDITEKPEISEDVILLEPVEAEKILAQADIERNNNDFDIALEKYHMVLKGTDSKEIKIKALEGMGIIASTRSLSEIKKYCQKLDPIMWDYKEPDQELVDAVIDVYIAIANNLVNEDKERAIKMLNHTFSLTRDFTLRYLAISSLKDIGTTPGKEFEENNFVDHAGCGKKINLTYPYNKTYRAGGDMALADGIKGTKNYNDGIWQGFLERDLEAIIDLDEKIVIQKISVNFLQDVSRGIFLPTSVEFAVSEDGEIFRVVSTQKNDISQTQEGAIIKEFIVALNNINSRYVRVKAKNVGICPPWHSTSGAKASLFVDEIKIY